MVSNHTNERCSAIIEYLKEHNGASRKDIQEALDIKSKTTVGNLLTVLIDLGYPITLTHGKVTLDTTCLDYSEQLSADIVRKWLVLYAAHSCMTADDPHAEYQSIYRRYKTIYKKLTDLSGDANTLSEYMFHKDLRDAVAEEYIYFYNTTDYVSRTNAKRRDIRTYDSTYRFPKLLSIDNAEIRSLVSFIDTHPDSILLYQDLKNKLLTMLKDYSDSTASGNSENKSTINVISDFLKHPYATYCLDLRLTAPKGIQEIKGFMTGLIIYSKDKNRFYILGKGKEGSSKTYTYKLLRADKIVQIIDTETPNLIDTASGDGFYKCEEILEHQHYIFDASIDGGSKLKPTPIEVLIINTPQNRRILTQLCRSRNSGISDGQNSIASIKIMSANSIMSNSLLPNLTERMCRRIEYYRELNESFDAYNQIIIDGEEIIHYTDMVLGKSDILPFLRFFHNDIHVITGVKKLIKDPDSFKARYEAAFYQQYGEDIKNYERI